MSACQLPVVADLVTARKIAGRFEAVISLAGTRRESGQLKHHPRRLWLPMEDTSDRGEARAPSTQAVKDILAFTGEGPGSILVHCRYGQSRSAAVALGLAVHFGWDPTVAVRELLGAHPAGMPFAPNQLLLELFDEELHCGGRLLTTGLDHTRL